MWALEFTASAEETLRNLGRDKSKRVQYKAVVKALGLLRGNPRHPGLNTHQWKGSPCPHGDKLWEAYAQNNTPGAYRIFFCYPPHTQQLICIVAITPHP